MIGAITAGLFSAGVTPSTNSYESIATYTVGSGGSNTIEFTSIPSTYKHLQLRMMTRTTGASMPSYQSLRFNTITTGYNNHTLEGNGSSASAGYENLVDRINFGQTVASTGTANSFGVCIIDILDYQNTNKYKTLRDLEGWDNNGSGAVIFRSGLWQNTAAISSIKVGPENFSGSVNYSQYSSFALYGIKG